MSNLDLIIQEQDITMDDTSKLVEAFGGPFKEAGEILANYKDLEVTDESQTELMAEAKKKRLILKKARNTAENNRKDLKAGIVKQGRAIDNVAKWIKEQIQPAEEYLSLQEKYIEIQEANRIAEIKSTRLEILGEYENLDTSVYDLESMTDQQFDELVDGLDIARENKIKLDAKLKAEREAAAEKERKEQEEKNREAAKLKAELEVKQKEAAEAKAKADKLEQEKRDREQAEAEAKAEEERKALEAEQSPDKDKFIVYADTLLEIPIPAGATPEGAELTEKVRGGINKLATNIKALAEQL